MKRLLLDSVILIDHLNAQAPATEFLGREEHRCIVSPVTRAEVLAGLELDGRSKASAFLDCFPCLDIDAEVGDLAAGLRRRHRWKLPDAFQMALAQKHGCALVTRNTRDFPPAEHAQVLVPYRL